MTERNPDDLYDALRDRLTDYGQEPPAQLWASIRAQLPPPVAQPQLRWNRQRQLRPVLLLSLLLAVVGGTSWQWWHAQSRPSTALSNRIVTFIKRTLGSDSARQPAATSHAAVELATSTAPTTKPEARITGPAVMPSARPDASTLAKQPPVSLSLANTPEAKSARTDAPFFGRAEVTLASPPLASQTTKRPHLAGQWAAAQPTSRNPASTIRPDREPSPLNSRMAVTGKLAGFAADTPTNQETLASASSTALLSPTAQIAGLSPSHLLGAQASIADSLLQANAISEARLGRYAAVPAAEARLLARLIMVQLAAWPAPAAPQPVAVEPSPQPMPLGSRWALEVLVGPALTYRYLNSASQPASRYPNGGSPPVNSTSYFSATDVAELEQPALGMGAQVGVRRTYGPYWTLTAGLGYAEYATRLVLQAADLAKLTPSTDYMRSDSGRTATRYRTTYRFVTLPLRTTYSWALSGRWHVGLLAGVEAAIYVGGSTKSPPCACQTQSLGLTVNPYRRFNLGSSLGAEVRYRLAERWELLAQPTATYLLTPLVRPEMASNPRHLLGGTALLGVSYELP